MWHSKLTHRHGESTNDSTTQKHQTSTILVQARIIAPGKRTALELCCGHAGLTAALWDAGVESTGIDWNTNRHSPSVPILHIDLTTEEGQQFVWKLLEDPTLVYIHMGPPCGTFTRARGKPIPEWRLEQGAPNPIPLRSTECPEGFPDWWLGKTDRLKVNKGNIIAKLCADIRQHA